jgi:hypothetical protein
MFISPEDIIILITTFLNHDIYANCDESLKNFLLTNKYNYQFVKKVKLNFLKLKIPKNQIKYFKNRYLCTKSCNIDKDIIKFLVSTIRNKNRSKGKKDFPKEKMNNSLYLHFNTENECDIFIKYSFYNFNFKFGNRCCEGTGIQVIFI